MVRTNQLLCEDTVYDLSRAYIAGALACRGNIPFWANPHRDGSQSNADWAAGHDNEAASLHRVGTIDVLEARPQGLMFKAG
jgi:hypothetical protein